ncbi:MULTISPECIES: hypothetical protein [unclassified Sphingomonas]|nr:MULTISPECIES: hypothetical protein [unclassified Sphingomonas]
MLRTGYRAASGGIMATLADSALEPSRPGVFTTFVDRWIYVFMATLFVAVVLIGFVPDSLGKLSAVRLGQRPPFPAILHVHAVLMGSWLLLLLAQTLLMATGRRGPHKQLGMISFALAPALVIAGFLLIPTMHRQMADAILHAPASVAAQLKPIYEFMLNIMLVQMRIGILFAALIGLALWARTWDAGLHKRLMILGTSAALPAATDRMLWLPSTLPDSPLTADLWPLAVIAPMFLWDLYRLRKVHRAYLIYLAALLVLAVPTHLLWGTSAWRAIALGILGIEGI